MGYGAFLLLSDILTHQDIAPVFTITEMKDNTLELLALAYNRKIMFLSRRKEESHTQRESLGMGPFSANIGGGAGMAATLNMYNGTEH